MSIPPSRICGLKLGHELGQPELDGDRRARAAGDGLAVDLREVADVRARVADEEVLGDREAEDAVAKEREAPVGVGAVIDPGRVRQRGLARLLGQVVDQRSQGSRARGSPGAPLDPPATSRADAVCHQPESSALAATKSTACPTVRIPSASCSDIFTP